MTKENSERNILLTGGTGHIGSLVCGNSLKEGHKVTVLDGLVFGDSAICTMNFLIPILSVRSTHYGNCVGRMV